MGFGIYARRVRDERLSTTQRHTALRHAIGQYCPLGYHATYAYLAATACPAPDFWRDSAALLRAMDALEASHTVWLRERAAFAAARRAEKTAGRRSPRCAAATRLHGPRWPGTKPPARPGLVAAVAQSHILFASRPSPEETFAGDAETRRLSDLHAALDTCACMYLTGVGHLDRATRGVLAETVRGIDRLVRPGYAPLNVYLLAWLRFARLLEYAADASEDPRVIGS